MNDIIEGKVKGKIQSEIHGEVNRRLLKTGFGDTQMSMIDAVRPSYCPSVKATLAGKLASSFIPVIGATMTHVATTDHLHKSIIEIMTEKNMPGFHQETIATDRGNVEVSIDATSAVDNKKPRIYLDTDRIHFTKQEKDEGADTRFMRDLKRSAKSLARQVEAELINGSAKYGGPEEYLQHLKEYASTTLASDYEGKFPTRPLIEADNDFIQGKLTNLAGCVSTSAHQLTK